MRDRHWYAVQEAERDEALLSLVEAVVFEGGRESCEDLGRVDEVDQVIGQI